MWVLARSLVCYVVNSFFPCFNFSANFAVILVFSYMSSSHILICLLTCVCVRVYGYIFIYMLSSQIIPFSLHQIIIYSPSDSSSAFVNHSMNGFVCSKKTDFPLFEWPRLYHSMIMSSVKTSALYNNTIIL